MSKHDDPAPKSDKSSGMTEREMDNVDEEDLPKATAERKRMRVPKPKSPQRHRTNVKR